MYCNGTSFVSFLPRRGSQVVAEFDGSGSLKTRFLHGPVIDQVLAQEDSATGDTLWAATDHLGTVRDVLDESGAVVKHIKYDSFGNVVAETNPNVNFGLGYTGREFEASIGLQYNRARWYDPRTGQFLSEDPIKDDLQNLYRYVGNGSLSATDPTGLETWFESLRRRAAGLLHAASVGNQIAANAIGGYLAGKHQAALERAGYDEEPRGPDIGGRIVVVVTELDRPNGGAELMLLPLIRGALTTGAAQAAIAADLLDGRLDRAAGKGAAFILGSAETAGPIAWQAALESVVIDLVAAMIEQETGHLISQEELQRIKTHIDRAGWLQQLLHELSNAIDPQYAENGRVAGPYLETVILTALGLPEIIEGIQLELIAARNGSRAAAESDVARAAGTAARAEAAGEFVGPRIGKSGFRTLREFSEAVLSKYQLFIDDAYAAVQLELQAGRLTPPKGVSMNTHIGQLVDEAARLRLRRWLQAEGIAEGPDGLIQVNRWLREPSGSGHRVPDIRISGAGIIIDGTIGIKIVTTPQVVDFIAFSEGDVVIIVRPSQLGGSYGIILP